MRKILLLASSLRTDSCNKKLINVISTLNLNQAITLEKLDFTHFITPPYNGDIEEKIGLPEQASAFIAQLKSADGLILSSPEYNFSTPGVLKNLIDWVSRAKPMPWHKYPIMLCSASPSLTGGNRGLLHTAQVLQFCCNAYIFPPMFSLANAYETFNNDGILKDKSIEQRLEKNTIEFIKFIQAIKTL